MGQEMGEDVGDIEQAMEEGMAGGGMGGEESGEAETYARHFEMVIRDAGVACVMASYTWSEGFTPPRARHLLNRYLAHRLQVRGLRDEGDWWAMPNAGNTGADPNLLKAAMVEAIKAGLDMELPWSLNFSMLESVWTSAARRP